MAQLLALSWIAGNDMPPPSRRPATLSVAVRTTASRFSSTISTYRQIPAAGRSIGSSRLLPWPVPAGPGCSVLLPDQVIGARSDDTQ